MKRLFLIGIFSTLTMGAAASASASTIDFGTSWPTFTGVGVGNYASDPYNLLLGATAGNCCNTEAEIAANLNDVLGTSYVAGDINKTNSPTELGGSDGYFLVPAGWTYVAVQYDGPNGGSIILELDGNDAKVPFDSAAIWGSGDQYGVSHFAVVGPVSVPDGGSSAALLGLSLLGVSWLRRTMGMRKP